MAKMKRPLGDLVSGKIGNVVFYQLNGESYVRAAPVRKKNSWTEQQKLSRQRISKASALWRALRSEQLSLIWNRAAVKMNGYAWFMKSNLPALALDGTLIDPRMIKVSAGKLHQPLNLQAERMPGNASTILVSWQNDPHLRGERLNDALMAVSSVGGKFSTITATALNRASLGGSFELPAKPVAAASIYLFFASSDGMDYSGSNCFVVG